MADAYVPPEQYRHIMPMTQEGSAFLRSFFDSQGRGWPEAAQKIGASRTGGPAVVPTGEMFPMYGEDPERDMFLEYLLRQYWRPGLDITPAPGSTPTPAPTPTQTPNIFRPHNINDPNIFGS